MTVFFLIITLVVAIVVIIHYEVLNALVLFIDCINMHHRARLLVGVFGVLAAHVVEIMLFACTYYYADRYDGWGHLVGNFSGTLGDCIYLSFTTFTTLGYGDIEPFGGLRYLTGVESLTGLLLIAWSASFLFLFMQKNWSRDIP